MHARSWALAGSRIGRECVSGGPSEPPGALALERRRLRGRLLLRLLLGRKTHALTHTRTHGAAYPVRRRSVAERRCSMQANWFLPRLLILVHTRASAMSGETSGGGGRPKWRRRGNQWRRMRRSGCVRRRVHSHSRRPSREPWNRERERCHPPLPAQNCSRAVRRSLHIYAEPLPLHGCCGAQLCSPSLAAPAPPSRPIDQSAALSYFVCVCVSVDTPHALSLRCEFKSTLYGKRQGLKRARVTHTDQETFWWNYIYYILCCCVVDIFAQIF